jgi:hypothetical protein
MQATVAALGGRCMDFSSANTTANNFLEWFRMEVQALPTAFAECNENITCYTLIGVFKMLAGVECEHLVELKSWCCLEMTHSFMMFLTMLKTCEKLVGFSMVCCPACRR